MEFRAIPFPIILSVILFCCSCFSPRPVVRIEPVAEPTRWNYGQAVLEAELDNISASAGFAYADRDHLVFDIEITNWREDRILIDPSGIFLEVAPGEGRVTAIDPEKHLFKLQMDESRREAGAKNVALIAGIATVAVAVAAIASDNNNVNRANPDNQTANDIDVINVAPTVIIGSGGAPANRAHAVDPWFWSDHTLRKTTLDKGQMVRGKVVFPKDNKLMEFEVLVPVEELMFTFAFKQRLFQP